MSMWAAEEDSDGNNTRSKKWWRQPQSSCTPANGCNAIGNYTGDFSLQTYGKAAQA